MINDLPSGKVVIWSSKGLIFNCKSDFNGDQNFENFVMVFCIELVSAEAIHIVGWEGVELSLGVCTKVGSLKEY